MTNGINEAAGSRTADSWFLRSMGDRDTYRGAYSIVTRSVQAKCGVEFEPLTLTSGVSGVPVGGGGAVSGGLSEGVFHLISAHEVVWRWRLQPSYVALCGELVETSGSVGTDECPSECACELSPSMAYCVQCLRAAIERNAKAGVEGDCAPGVTVRAER